MNTQYNYYIATKGLLEDCDKKENMAVTVAAAAAASCYKRRL
jgi:hypothetical protein